MKITTENIEHIARLTKLEISDKDKENFTKDMNVIIEYLEIIKELDLKDVKPTVHVLPITNVYREDVVIPSLDRELVLANAKSSGEGCFKVAKVVD